MPYFGDWFGPNGGDTYFGNWFDPAESAGPPSANGGASKARILGTIAPRPQVPPWRYIEGASGAMHQEVRRFLSELASRGHLWGNHVEVTFPNGTDSVRVDTGLGGPAEGYHRVGGEAITVSDGTPPAGTDPTPERGIIWLKGDAAGTVRLFIY